VRLLWDNCRWDADLVRDDFKACAAEHPADADAVLVVDGTGFLKKGNGSAVKIRPLRDPGRDYWLLTRRSLSDPGKRAH